MPKSAVTDSPADTRRRLLQAALKAFGQRDYDAVSTREIVEAADANIAAISYHFGGKKGLYMATADYLAESLHNEVHDELARIEAEIAGADAARCRRMLGDLVSGFTERLLIGDFGEDAPGLIFREQNHPTEAYEALYDKLFGPMHRTMTALVAGATGLSADTDEARMAAHGLLGYAIAFRASRTALLRHLGRSAYSGKDVAQIRSLVAAMTAAAVDYTLVGDRA